MNILKNKLTIIAISILILSVINNTEIKAQVNLQSSPWSSMIELQGNRLFQQVNDNDLNGLRVFSRDNDTCSIQLYGGTTGWNVNNFGIISGYRNQWDKKVFTIEHSNSSPILFAVEDTYSQLATGNARIIQHNDGRVAIGSTNTRAWNLFKDDSNVQITKYKLFVETGILTEKVKVAVAGQGDWADYVFEEDYEMLPINELEDYVSKNKHLPNVPSAEEMVENGLDVAKMDAKLLEKIEEAYLYIIDINKAMETMSEKVDALSAENESLKTSLQTVGTSNQ